MAILDSVKKLATKIGAETSGRDITEQINLINKKLDEASSSGRDIAEAVSVFADKEDGTATFTTKTITENGTYDASDDSVSGYSSVTVDVSGGMTYDMIKLPLFNKGFDSAYDRVVYGAIIKSSNGVYVLPSDEVVGTTSPTLILADPLVSMSDAYSYDESCIMFTPDENLDFTLPPFNDSNIIGIDTIVPGDGMTYELNSTREGTLRRTVKKYNKAFEITIS